jgi:RimJ/RimL family protein N-acetyltransferase
MRRQDQERLEPPARGRGLREPAPAAISSHAVAVAPLLPRSVESLLPSHPSSRWNVAPPLPRDVSGRNASLRLVEADDARFIVELRNSRRGRRLSPIGNDAGRQLEWIRSYKDREARGEEYYFIIQHRCAGDVGTLRLHDVAGGSFWWGSWIVREGAPTQTAAESFFLVYELAFFTMQLERARFAVRKDNLKSAGFHRRFGATVSGEDEARVLFELRRDRYAAARPRLARRFAALGPLSAEQERERLPSHRAQAV